MKLRALGDPACSEALALPPGRKKGKTGWPGSRGPVQLRDPLGRAEWTGAKAGGTQKAERLEGALQDPTEGADEGRTGR